VILVVELLVNFVATWWWSLGVGAACELRRDVVAELLVNLLLSSVLCFVVL
jgi:hypothetical protein